MCPTHNGKPVLGASLVDQMVKSLPAMKTWVQSLGWEDPLEKGMDTHCSILAWRISWTEEPGRLQSMGLQRVGHHWATNNTTCYMWNHESRSSMNTGLKIQTYILKKKRIQERWAGRWYVGGEGILRGKGIQKKLTQKPRDKAFMTKAMPNVYFSMFPQQLECQGKVYLIYWI